MQDLVWLYHFICRWTFFLCIAFCNAITLVRALYYMISMLVELNRQGGFQFGIKKGISVAIDPDALLFV